MRAVLDVFKSELVKSYGESRRLQDNLRRLLALYRQETDASPAYRAARCVLNALYRTAKVCDVFAWQLAKKCGDDASRITDVFSWEARVPQSMHRGAIIQKVQKMVQKIAIPQYYGGIRSIVSLERRRFIPRKTSAEYRNTLARKLAALADEIANRMTQEKYIRFIENEVIPYIFSNINELHRIKEVSAEEQAEIFEGFKDMLKRNALPGASSLFRVHCVDIRGLESSVERNTEGLCITSKMNTRFALMYHGETGVRRTMFVNYEFVLKFNHFFDEERVPLLLEIHFEPLKY